METFRSSREFAANRDRVLDKLDEGLDEVYEHLMKLYCYRDVEVAMEECWLDWSASVWHNKRKTSKVKKGKSAKYLRFETIFDEIWTIQDDTLKHAFTTVRGLSQTCYKRYRFIDYSEREGAEEFCKSYITWLAKKLSEEGEVTLDEVREWLSDELLLNF